MKYLKIISNIIMKKNKIIFSNCFNTIKNYRKTYIKYIKKIKVNI